MTTIEVHLEPGKARDKRASFVHLTVLSGDLTVTSPETPAKYLVSGDTYRIPTGLVWS